MMDDAEKEAAECNKILDFLRKRFMRRLSTSSDDFIFGATETASFKIPEKEWIEFENVSFDKRGARVLLSYRISGTPGSNGFYIEHWVPDPRAFFFDENWRYVKFADESISGFLKTLFKVAKITSIRCGSWNAVFIDKEESFEEVLVKADLEDV